MILRGKVSLDRADRQKNSGFQLRHVITNAQ